MSENIPDEDMISRLLFEPSMRRSDDIVWENVFQFPSKDGGCESVVWRKYAPEIVDVHAKGCEKQLADHNKGNTRSTYFGAFTGNVGSIRELRSGSGISFTIEHVPEQGIFHAHIAFPPGSKKTDRGELKVMLKAQFGPVESHTCA